MFLRSPACVSTSLSAIAALLLPDAISASTSRSRGVSRATPLADRVDVRSAPRSGLDQPLRPISDITSGLTDLRPATAGVLQIAHLRELPVGHGRRCARGATQAIGLSIGLGHACRARTPRIGGLIGPLDRRVPLPAARRSRSRAHRGRVCAVFSHGPEADLAAARARPRENRTALRGSGGRRRQDHEHAERSRQRGRTCVGRLWPRRARGAVTDARRTPQRAVRVSQRQLARRCCRRAALTWITAILGLGRRSRDGALSGVGRAGRREQPSRGRPMISSARPRGRSARTT